MKDYNDLFLEYDAKEAKEEEMFPHCDCCGSSIIDYYWSINGEIYCEECLNDNFKHDAEDYTGYED